MHDPLHEKTMTVPCAGCGQPLELTWTKSADGWPIYHDTCYAERRTTP